MLGLQRSPNLMLGSGEVSTGADAGIPGEVSMGLMLGLRISPILT